MSNNSPEGLILKLGPTLNSQILYLFGANHSNNPNDSQFTQLQQLWNEFLSVVDNDKIVFTEGAIREVPTNYEEAIRQRGEVGATQWLAKKSEILAIYPEPDESEQRKKLCSIFDPQTVAYALITQNLAAWFRQTTHQSDFTEATERSVKREARFAEIFGFTPSTSWLHDQHKKLFGNQRLEDQDFLDKISDPRKNDTPINAIVAGRTKIRNEYIHNCIVEIWKSGKNIFMVYGKGHFVVLEPILKKMVTDKPID